MLKKKKKKKTIRLEIFYTKKTKKTKKTKFSFLRKEKQLK